MKVCDYDDEIVVANDEKDENIKGGRYCWKWNKSEKW